MLIEGAIEHLLTKNNQLSQEDTIEISLFICTILFIDAILSPSEYKLFFAAVAPEAVECGRPAAALAAHAGILQNVSVFDLTIKVTLVDGFLPKNHFVDMLQLENREDLGQQLERQGGIL